MCNVDNITKYIKGFPFSLSFCFFVINFDKNACLFTKSTIIKFHISEIFLFEKKIDTFHFYEKNFLTKMF